MTESRPPTDKSIPKLSIYPDDIPERHSPPIKPKPISYIQPMVHDVRQYLQQKYSLFSDQLNRSFLKFDSHLSQMKTYARDDRVQLSAIGISSYLATFILVRKRKPIWKYSLPILVGVGITSYAYLRKEWRNFDLYSTVISLQRRTPLPTEKHIGSSSENPQESETQRPTSEHEGNSNP